MDPKESSQRGNRGDPVVEIAGTAFIVWYAVTWRRPEVAAEVTVGATTEVADSRKFARREAA